MLILGWDIGRQHTGFCAYSTITGNIIRVNTINIPIAKARKECDFNPDFHRLMSVYKTANELIIFSIEDYIKSSTEYNIEFQNGIPVIAIIEDYAYGHVEDIASTEGSPIEYNYDGLCPHCNNNLKIKTKEWIDRRPLQLAETNGIIHLALMKFGVPIIRISPSQLKLFAAGKGNATKNDIRKAMKEKHTTLNIDLKDSHQYDAFALCYVGRYIVAYCRNPLVFDKKSYEYNVINQLAFEQQHRDVFSFVKKSISASC